MNESLSLPFDYGLEEVVDVPCIELDEFYEYQVFIDNEPLPYQIYLQPKLPKKSYVDEILEEALVESEEDIKHVTVDHEMFHIQIKTNL